MLHVVSWAAFLKAAIGVVVCYYSSLGVLLYRQKLLSLLRGRGKPLLCGLAFILLSTWARAQDGNQGISQANTMMRGYFETGITLVYAIGGVLGLIGAVKVFREWNSGHQQEAYRAAGNWFGSCLFLVLVASVLRSFFGL